MFLRKAKNKKTGRTYLSIVESYRVPGVKNSRSRTIESLGYLDELEKNMMTPSHSSRLKLRKEKHLKKKLLNKKVKPSLP